MRKQRTHRLITRGAALESIIPEVKEMSERAFCDAVETYFGNENYRNAFRQVMDEANRAAGLADHAATYRASKNDPVIQKGGA